MQWIQQLIINNISKGVIPTPPPIITRVFQELSNGIIMCHDARKLRDVPFPFPYAQMMRVLKTIQWIITPLICAITIHDWWWAFLLTFIPILLIWGANDIAMELEVPF